MAGFVLLVLTVIFVLQHGRIRQWYLEKTGFLGTQLASEDDQASLPLARGVEMEAYSVWDSGRELCFHVFVYNVQPGISIDYRTGESRAA